MTFDEFASRLSGMLTFLANLIVCVAAVNFYQRRPMRCVLLIAIACGLGALVAALPWMAGERVLASRVFGHLLNLIGTADLMMWAIGSCWLFREYEKQDQQRATI